MYEEIWSVIDFFLKARLSPFCCCSCRISLRLIYVEFWQGWETCNLFKFFPEQTLQKWLTGNMSSVAYVQGFPTFWKRTMLLHPQHFCSKEHWSYYLVTDQKTITVLIEGHKSCRLFNSCKRWNLAALRLVTPEARFTPFQCTSSISMQTFQNIPQTEAMKFVSIAENTILFYHYIYNITEGFWQ